jgi:hypothetical protein
MESGACCGPSSILEVRCDTLPSLVHQLLNRDDEQIEIMGPQNYTKTPSSIIKKGQPETGCPLVLSQ